MSRKQTLVFIVILFLFSGCNKKTPCEKEIYILPEGFWGTMIVYFDQPDGQEIQYENDARVYRIPPLGYLKTQFPKNGGCMNNHRIHFFFEDSLGVRTPVDYFLDIPKDSIPQNEDYVLFTFLSNKDSKPDFVIHFVGKAHEFNDLTKSVQELDPVKILEAL